MKDGFIWLNDHNLVYKRVMIIPREFDSFEIMKSSNRIVLWSLDWNKIDSIVKGML